MTSEAGLPYDSLDAYDRCECRDLSEHARTIKGGTHPPYENLSGCDVSAPASTSGSGSS